MKKKILLLLALLCTVVQGAWAWEGSGTEADPWLIKTTADLGEIATNVNSGAMTYAKKYFKLCNDLTYDNTRADNFTPIGGTINGNERPFSGNFDGCGHTISGIRFSKGGRQIGLFGRTGKSALIHNVILADAHIYAHYDVGGIVGYQYGGTVQNCTVESTVTIGSPYGIVKGYINFDVHNLGGIVGQNYGGKIEYCTSSVTFDKPSPGARVSTKDTNYGGICGYSVGNLRWNLTVGANIPFLDDGSYGAICGGQDGESGRLYENYYNNCTVADVANASNVGIHNAEAKGNGAKCIVMSGEGTEAKPYIIKSYTRWRIFACYVNNGDNFSGKYWKLTADINAAAMVGKSETKSFQGIFDGGGHTLTVDYKNSVAGAAPFSHVKNATIKNLRVAGTITAGAQYAGGIVGQSHGTLSLTGCASSVTINSSVSGNGLHGGLVGQLSGTDNTMSGCVFDGSFATTNGTTGCGGFVGSAESGGCTISNSLMSPVSVAAGMVGSTFNGNATINNCNYLWAENLPESQGTLSYSSSVTPAINGGQLTVTGGTGAAGIGSDDSTSPSGTLKIGYTNTTDFVQCNSYAVSSITFADNQKFRLDNTTTVATADNISGQKVIPYPKGSTADYPITISSTDEWNELASKVASGTVGGYRGQFIKLASDDVTVTAEHMMGSDSDHPFMGTFDGDGHTLRVSIGTESEPFAERFCGPFRCTYRATIQNLKTIGDIYTADINAGAR